MTDRLGRLLAILAAAVLLFTLATCGGGGGSKKIDPETKVTITGVVDDGGDNTVTSDATCRYVDKTGTKHDEDSYEEDLSYELIVPPEVEGYIYCGPRTMAMTNLNLTTFSSTVGIPAGETKRAENVTPTTTVAADIIRHENPADPEARKDEIVRQAQYDPNLALVTEMAGRLYRAMAAAQVNVSFGNDRGDGGDPDPGGSDDGGGVGGEAGDGADFSPLPGAECAFVTGGDFQGAVPIRSAALADYLDDGELTRPDLANLGVEPPEGKSPADIQQAFDALFGPDGLGAKLTARTNDDGRYFLATPPNLAGYVRCIPQDHQNLLLGTYVSGRGVGDAPTDQDVTPATTVFSALIAPQLDSDLGTVKANFLADIDGLQETHLVFGADGALESFELQPDADPADNDVGLVAFSATALFNIFYKNDLDVDFLAAIEDLVDDQAVDPAFLEAQGVPADRTGVLARIVNDSVDGAESELGTDLAAALSKARINVTVMSSPDGSGLIPGAVVDIEGTDVTCAQGCGQATNAEGQLTLTLTGVPETATAITVTVSSVSGYAPYSATTEVVAFATVDLDVVLPTTTHNLTLQTGGDGNGNVTSTPAGIDCDTGSGSCSAPFASGTQVTLSATPDAGSAFGGWSGDCTGAGTTCTLSMDADASVTASFSSQCSDEDVTIGSAEASFGADGGQGNFAVTAPEGCPWSVSLSQSSSDWITLDSGSSGSGDGTVRYTVLENTDNSERTGSISVGNKTHRVTQGPVSCTITITPENRPFTRTGGSGSILVTVPDACTWTASTEADWITITPGYSGSGDGTVNYTVAANTTSPERAGIISIAGMPHTVTQEAALLPPTPNPMTWATEPHETSTAIIAMTASTATDTNAPVSYQFDFVDSTTGGSGGTDSSWQSGTTYTDSGLGANHRYGYRVRARDSDDNQTSYSATSYDYTDIETPSGISFGAITTASIQARSTNTPSGLTRGSSGLIVYNVTGNTNSGWRQNNNNWTSASLSVNRRYGFNARARNGDSDATGLAATAYRYTYANTPLSGAFSNVTGTSIQANWTANGNPSGTEYYCENTTAGTNSGWITTTSWSSTGLSCEQSYTFRVRARNGDDVVTGWRDLGSQRAGTCPDTAAPTPNPMTWATAPYETGTTGIAMTATTASDPNPPVTYQFDYVSSPTGGAGGTDSGWQGGTSYTDTGLGVNHQYGYRVRARDGGGFETAYSTPVNYDYTDIQTPSGITFGTISTTSIQARSSNTPSGLTRGSSGLIFYNVTGQTSSGWRQNNNYWSSTLLSVNQRYGFNARARNGDANMTGLSATAYRYTLANQPGYAQFTSQTRTSIQANWTVNGNPTGTQYYCENVTAGTNSGWITATSWNSSNLNCGTRYQFRVRARNGDNVVTTWRELDDTSTAACLPVVTVAVVDSTAAEASEFPDNGAYRISRTGSTASRLAVNISMSGTATHGTDYQTISSPVYIAAGRSYVDVSLTVLNDWVDEPHETARLTIGTSGAYARGGSYYATITILDDDETLLINCPMEGEGGDLYYRGFYVSNYQGDTLTGVTLYFSSVTSGSYSFRLTAREGSYSGRLVGTSTSSRTLDGTKRAVFFSFSGSPAVTQGSALTFAIDVTSGPSTSVYYSVQTSSNCPVIQTNYTTPPLDSIRRNGIAVYIWGDSY